MRPQPTPGVISHSSFGTAMSGRTWSAESGYRYGFNGKEGDDEFSVDEGSYDFGARMYDSRLGRWWSVDPRFSKASGWTPYRMAFDSPITFVELEGEFEVDPKLQAEYPKLALVILNADKLYNNQPLPPDVQEALKGIDVDAIFNDTFRSAFENWSTLSKVQIQEILKPGNGPLVQVKDLETIGTNGQPALVNGKNEVEYNKYGTPLDRNLVNEDGRSGLLSIDIELAEVMEFELGGDPSNLSGLAGKYVSKSDKISAFRSFISTLFHETVHYGRNETGVGNTGGIEAGKAFEKAAFGEDVARTKKNSLNLSKDGLSDGSNEGE